MLSVLRSIIQPYYQPNPSPPSPFSLNSAFNDPPLYIPNPSAWALNVKNSNNIIIFGSFASEYREYHWLRSVTIQAPVFTASSSFASLYSFFNTYLCPVMFSRITPKTASLPATVKRRFLTSTQHQRSIFIAYLQLRRQACWVSTRLASSIRLTTSMALPRPWRLGLGREFDQTLNWIMCIYNHCYRSYLCSEWIPFI